MDKAEEQIIKRDIEEEMSHYDFTNKIIYCNCDNPATSNFYKFFRSNFDTLKLKS